MMDIKLKVISDDVILPKYQTIGSSGADICAYINKPVVLEPYKTTLIETGLFIEIPSGYEVQIRSRSGLALRNGIIVLNSPGTIDSDYRGEIKIILFNTSSVEYTINPGERIAQMVLSKIEKINFVLSSLSSTQRDASGFGSTGLKNNA